MPKYLPRGLIGRQREPMGDWRTITFDCPEDLSEELEDAIEESDVHENRSQFLRWAVRRAVRHGELDLPQDLLNEIDAEIEDSLMFESRKHYIRVAVKNLQATDDFDAAE